MTPFISDLYDNQYRKPKATSISGCQRCYIKISVLTNFVKFTGKGLCQSLFFKKVACKFYKKETLAQVFSSEFCKIFKNSFFTEHQRTTASILLGTPAEKITH